MSEHYTRNAGPLRCFLLETQQSPSLRQPELDSKGMKLQQHLLENRHNDNALEQQKSPKPADFFLTKSMYAPKDSGVNTSLGTNCGRGSLSKSPSGKKVNRSLKAKPNTNHGTSDQPSENAYPLQRRRHQLKCPQNFVSKANRCGLSNRSIT